MPFVIEQNVRYPHSYEKTSPRSVLENGHRWENDTEIYSWPLSDQGRQIVNRHKYCMKDEIYRPEKE